MSRANTHAGKAGRRLARALNDIRHHQDPSLHAVGVLAPCRSCGRSQYMTPERYCAGCIGAALRSLYATALKAKPAWHWPGPVEHRITRRDLAEVVAGLLQ